MKKWNDSIIINELQKIIDQIGHFPSRDEFRSMNRCDLEGAINLHGGINKFKSVLGYKLIKKSTGYWTFEVTLNELQNVTKQIGHFPTTNELIKLNKNDLRGAIVNIHGGINKFRKLLKYDYVKKPISYWTQDNIIKELQDITEKIHHFPSFDDIKIIKSKGLSSAITRNGGINKFKKLMGYNITKQSNGYWNEETIIKELRLIIDKLGHFPSLKEFKIMKKTNLYTTINIHGGHNKFRKLLNQEIIKNTNGYWNYENTLKELKQVINEIGHFPKYSELNILKKSSLSQGINKFGGINKFRELLGYIPIRRPIGYWNDNTIIEDLNIIKKQIGHFPSNIEIKKMNHNDLAGAINTHGGYNKFRKIFGDELLIKPKGYWNDNSIIKELQLIINQIKHFPSENEIKNNSDMGLNSAIRSHGGYIKFRKLLGYNLIHKPKNYWEQEVIIEDLQKIISKIGHFPSQKELNNMKRYDLSRAISQNGGFPKFRKLLGYEFNKKPKGYWNKELIILELKQIVLKLGHFPTQKELLLLNRQDLIGAIRIYGGIQIFRTLCNYDLQRKPGNFWNNETIQSELKIIIDKIKHFPSKNELSYMKRDDLSVAISRYGNIDKYRILLGYPPSIEDSINMGTYVVRRGYKSEKEVKNILIKYCKIHNFTEPQYNVKLSRGNILEFVCFTGQKIGIDVTNTKIKNGEIIRRKYIKKDYHKYLDELWIVVLSDVFTDKDYIKFNEESPDNVKIMSVWDLIDTLQVDIDEYSRRKLEALETCTIRTKNDLINQLKNRTLTQYAKIIPNNVQNIEISNKNSLFNF